MKLEFPVGLAAGVMRKDSEVRADGRWDEDVPRSAHDPDARIAAMEQDGLVGEVLYPTLGSSMFGITDHDLLWAFLGAFNSWFGEFCSAHPDRLKGIGMLVLDDGQCDIAVAGLRKAREQGLSGIMIPLDVDGAERLLNPEFDPFWAIAQDLDVPVHFRVSSNRRGHLISNKSVVDFVMEPAVMDRTLCSLIFGGLFDRYPHLQVISAENDASWIGNICERADYVNRRYRNLRGYQLQNERTPSEIIVNNWSFTFTRDFTAPAVSEVASVRLMWGSEFPHNVSTWPNFVGIPSRRSLRVALPRSSTAPVMATQPSSTGSRPDRRREPIWSACGSLDVPMVAAAEGRLALRLTRWRSPEP